MLDKLQGMIGGANIKLDWRFFLIMLAVALLIGAIIYVYKKYIVPKLNPTYVANKEFNNTDQSSKGKSKIAHVLLFTTSWCPHCRTLKKEGVWDEFIKQNQGKTVNGYTLNIEEKDCSNDTDPQVKSILDEYSVEGFPSIKLLKDGDSSNQAIDFDAKPEIDSLNQFITTVL